MLSAEIPKKVKVSSNRRTLLLPFLFIIPAFLTGLSWLAFASLIIISSYILFKRLSSSIRRLPLRNVIQTILLLIYVIIISMGIKLFVIDVFRIPSESMEDTLLVNDVIVVNKLVYGPKLPRNIFEISWVNIFLKKRYKRETAEKVPYKRAGGISPVKQGDIFVYQTSDTYFVVKRCVAIAGDTMQLSNGQIITNTVKYKHPSTLRTEQPKGPKVIKEPLFATPPGTHWTPDNIGPLIIPAKGMTVQINSYNYPIYKKIIRRELRNLIHKNLNTGFPYKYTFKQNYYFVMGDNRKAAFDSRYYGFIPEDKIVGKAQFILFSTYINGFKWDRFFKWIH